MGIFSKYKPVAQFQGIDKPAKVVSKKHLFLQKLYAVVEPLFINSRQYIYNKQIVERSVCYG